MKQQSQAENVSDEANITEKKEVLKIFEAIGINIANDLLDIDRIYPKRNQAWPRHILVKLKSLNTDKKYSKSSKTFKRQPRIQTQFHQPNCS